MTWDPGGAPHAAPYGAPPQPYAVPSPVIPQLRRYPPVLPLRGRRPPLAVFLVIVGIFLSLAIWKWARFGSTTPLDPDLSSQVWWSEVVVAGIVVLVVVLGRWSRSTGLVPRRGSAPAVPRIALAVCLTGAVTVLAAGLDLHWGAATYVVVLVNVLAIGVFEETLFRGLLWASLPVRWSASRVLLVTSLAFGALHLANGFSTGAWGTAVGQACIVSVTGLGLGAVRLRTGWLGLSIVTHAMIDGGLASAAQSVSHAVAVHPPGTGIPVVVVLSELALVCLYITLGVTGITVLVRTFRAERQARALVARFPELSVPVPETAGPSSRPGP